MDTYTVDQGQVMPVEQRAARRMRTTEEKLGMVQETFTPGISVAAIARRHGVNANLLFTWRRQHEQGMLAQRTRSPRATKLVPIKVSPAPVKQSTTESAIEIELPCGARVRISGDVPAERLAPVLRALAQR